MTYKSGFTFIELIVIIGVFAVLVGLGAINLLGATRKSGLMGAIDILIADLKEQQIKAITGDTISGNPSSYGIYFGQGQYVMFAAGTYNPGDPANIAVPLDGNIVFSSTNFPNTSVVFASGSGEVINFNSQAHSVTLFEKESAEGKTIDINRLGVVTSVN